MNKKKTTEKLMSNLIANKKITDDELEAPLNLVELLSKRIQAIGLTKSDVLKKCDIDYKNGYKYLNGERNFKRDLLLKILIVLQYSASEIQEILKKSKYPVLYIKHKRDLIIFEGVYKKKSLAEINDNLSNEGEYRL